MLAPWKKSYGQPRKHIKKQRHYFTNKGTSNQSYGFSSSHVWMWELEYKESWAPKNWCFWTVVLEKTRESPLDCKEIQPVHPEGDQSWIFIGRAKAEAEDEMVGWHHWLYGHEFEQALRDGAGQGSLVCFSSWGHKESYMTEWLNKNNIYIHLNQKMYPVRTERLASMSILIFFRM